MLGYTTSMNRRKQSKPMRCNSEKKFESHSLVECSNNFNKAKTEIESETLSEPLPKKLKTNHFSSNARKTYKIKPSTSSSASTSSNVDSETNGINDKKLDSNLSNLVNNQQSAKDSPQSLPLLSNAQNSCTNQNLVNTSISNQSFQINNIVIERNSPISPTLSTVLTQVEKSKTQTSNKLTGLTKLQILKLLASIVENGKLNEKMNQEVALIISALLPKFGSSKTSTLSATKILESSSIQSQSSSVYPLKNNPISNLDWVKNSPKDYLLILNQQVDNLEKTLSATTNSNSLVKDDTRKHINVELNSTNSISSLANAPSMELSAIGLNNTSPKMFGFSKAIESQKHSSQNVSPNCVNEKISSNYSNLLFKNNLFKANEVPTTSSIPSEANAAEARVSNPLNMLSNFVAKLGANNKEPINNCLSNQINNFSENNAIEKLNYFKTNFCDNILKEKLFEQIEQTKPQNDIKVSQREISSHFNILKCTICSKCCGSLDELAEHKRETGHISSSHSSTMPANLFMESINNYTSFNFVPKTDDILLQTTFANRFPLIASFPSSFNQLPQNFANKSLLSTNSFVSFMNKRQSVANAIGRRGRFGFRCTLCGFSSMNMPVAQHMTTAHSFQNPSEWREAVVLIPVHK